jgi:hypothetical protein
VQIVTGLVAWLLAGFGVALLFKTRILGFEIAEEPMLEPAPARLIASRGRR